jgi:hypothetical protein
MAQRAPHATGIQRGRDTGRAPFPEPLESYEHDDGGTVVLRRYLGFRSFFGD